MQSNKVIVREREKPSKSVFESIFGSKDYSLNGPLFYLLSGAICSAGFIILFLLGVYLPNLFSESTSLRPEIIYPFIGIGSILFLSGAVIGISLGIIGIIWSSLKRKN